VTTELFMVERNLLIELTGKHRKKDQISWLRTNGYVFHVNHKGPVVVMHEGAPVKHQYPEPPKGLLDQTEIIKRATPIKPICGVYFLISGSRVMYVGQSSRVLERINEHVRNRVPFEAFYFIEVPRRRLLSVEAAYIKAFRPPRNVVGAS
jgi:hypothetical protein